MREKRSSFKSLVHLDTFWKGTADIYIYIYIYLFIYVVFFYSMREINDAMPKDAQGIHYQAEWVALVHTWGGAEISQRLFTA